MKLSISAILLACGASAFAQFPLADSWIMNTDGSTASYEYFPGPPPTTELVELDDSTDVLQVCYTDDEVYVRANGLPSYQMGPWHMNPNEPEANMSIYKFPRFPEEAAVKTSQPFGGPLGVAVNGVRLYGAGDARSYDASENENSSMGDGLWNGDAWTSEGETMDEIGAGHPDGSGNYHYHATPIQLYGDGTEHSLIVGWAFDGFPIYGPYGYSNPDDASSSIVRMESSYGLRAIDDRSILPDGSPSVPAGPSDFDEFPLGTYWEDYLYTEGSGNLDQYNGRECITPEFPEGTYAYFITMDETGEPAFPYITGLEYYGEVNPADIGPMAGDETIPADATCVEGASGVQELADPLAFLVYPNPATNQLNVVGANGVKYQIFDQVGRLVTTGTNLGTIDISTLEKGTYILNMNVEGEAAYLRFVKE